MFDPRPDYPEPLNSFDSLEQVFNQAGRQTTPKSLNFLFQLSPTPAQPLDFLRDVKRPA